MTGEDEKRDRPSPLDGIDIRSDLDEDSRDAFDKLVADGTNNKLNIASHFPYSPERLRVSKNGSRLFPEYNSVSEYNHNDDVHEISPSGGDTVVLETAERPEYVVQYEQIGSYALSVSQQLNSGDEVIFGLYDGSDGYYIQHQGSDASNEATLVVERNGSQVATRDISLSKDLTNFTRFETRTNWYNVGRELWRQTYTDSHQQHNDTLGTVSRDDGRGPRLGNLPLRYEVTAASGTSNLTLNAGSLALITLGDVSSIRRSKISTHSITVGSTGSWLPILAVRNKRTVVNAELRNVEVVEYDSNGDVELSVHGHDPSNVVDGSGNQLTDSNFSTPAPLTPDGTVVETSTDVAQAADSTGSTTSSTSNPGGFQISYGSLNTSGRGQQQLQSVPRVVRKSPLYPQDVAVVWAQATDATGNVEFQLTYSEEW